MKLNTKLSARVLAVASAVTLISAPAIVTADVVYPTYDAMQSGSNGGSQATARQSRERSQTKERSYQKSRQQTKGVQQVAPVYNTPQPTPAPVAPPVYTAPVASPAPVAAAPVVAAKSGFPWLLGLAGLAVLGGAIYLIADDKDDPVTP